MWHAMRPCHVEQRPTEISRLPDLGKPCQGKVRWKLSSRAKRKCSEILETAVFEFLVETKWKPKTCDWWLHLGLGCYRAISACGIWGSNTGPRLPTNAALCLWMCHLDILDILDAVDVRMYCVMLRARCGRCGLTKSCAILPSASLPDTAEPPRQCTGDMRCIFTVLSNMKTYDQSVMKLKHCGSPAVRCSTWAPSELPTMASIAAYAPGSSKDTAMRVFLTCKALMKSNAVYRSPMGTLWLQTASSSSANFFMHLSRQSGRLCASTWRTRYVTQSSASKTHLGIGPQLKDPQAFHVPPRSRKKVTMNDELKLFSWISLCHWSISPCHPGLCLNGSREVRCTGVRTREASSNQHTMTLNLKSPLTPLAGAYSKCTCGLLWQPNVYQSSYCITPWTWIVP